MDAIGGYFELELNNFGSVWHNNAIALNSGRNALEYILIQNTYSKVYIPYYTCDVILQPLIRQNIKYEFYFLQKDFTPDIPKLAKNEVLLYVNYFGIMIDIVKLLINKYANLIIDNSHAFFEMPYKNTPVFYSPRKFFGLPDGGFTYTNNNELNLERDNSEDKISHLIKRIENGAEMGFEYFKQNEAKIENIPLRRMSLLTEQLLKNINFENIRKIRKRNFKLLHQSLYMTNELTPFIESNNFDTPLVYPYLNKKNNNLRRKLIAGKIFVASYWPNVSEWLSSKESFEIYLQNNLIPLPIDQRYNENDIFYIINNINVK